jgi:hypothetical protein
LFSLRREKYPQKADGALEKAIRFFDLDPEFASNPRYRKDKRAALIGFLEEGEATNVPLWKKAKTEN